jgi:glycosyltransferase involved in cell wall biosynthesis
MKNEKTRIMYLIGSLSSGGAERQLVELAKNIDKTKYHAFIVIYHNIIHYKYILDAEGVKVVCIEKKFKYSPLFLWRLTKFIRKNKIDIIHSYMSSVNIWARLAGKLAGCKIIIPSLRSTNLSPKYYLLERFLAKWTTIVITNSYAAKLEYLKNINIPNDNFVLVIHNGIDLDAIENLQKIAPENLMSKYNIEKDDFIIVDVAGIDRNKNQLCLIKALKLANIGNLKILFVGYARDEIYYRDLQNYVKEYGLENSVSFLGEQQNVFSIMNTSDLFVLMSLREAFPNAIMEAMSMGLPIISSDVGDVKYLVKDGINGFLFPKDDHQRLAELIIKVYSLSIDERREMGKAGRRIIEENYTIEKMVKETEAIYEECLKLG